MSIENNKDPKMIPAGYMAKNIINRPDWIKTKKVEDIYSVSGCISTDIDDYINYWKHNGYWFFDSPQIIQDLAIAENINLSDRKILYYEVYEKQYDDENNNWVFFKPEPSFETNVIIPREKELIGYDMVSFYCGTSPECSPLSCNSLADEIKVNSHCLLDSFGKAKKYLEDGLFTNAEPGPYRIMAIYSL